MSLDPDLIRRMDANMLAYWGAYGKNAWSQHQELPGATLIFTDIQLFLFNSVNLTEPNTDTFQEAFKIGADFAKRSGMPVLWRVSPNAKSPAITELIEASGLHFEGKQPAMLADLNHLPDVITIPDFNISGSDDATQNHDWGALTWAAFELDPAIAPAMCKHETAIPATDMIDQIRFTGHLGGTPVGVSSTVMAGGLAGLYAIATLPTARKHGVGSAMTFHAMAEGKRRGADQVILQATEMGRPVYEKLGFETVFAYDEYLQT